MEVPKMFGRQKIATLVAEFLGTGVLTLLTISVLRSQLAVIFFIALAAGLAYTVMTFAVGRISGAHFNPALTLGLWTARRISTLTAAMYIIVQLLGAWGAYGLYTYLANTPLQASKSHFTARVMIAEAIGAAIFAFVWAAAFYQRLVAGSAAAYAGLAYVSGLLAASVALGFAFINPGVALGVRAWNVWGSVGWGTYVLGPVLGAVIGINLYTLLFAEGKAVLAGVQVGGGSTSSAAKKPSRKAKK